jgi:hypothetical protein
VKGETGVGGQLVGRYLFPGKLRIDIGLWAQQLSSPPTVCSV